LPQLLNGPRPTQIAQTTTGVVTHAVVGAEPTGAEAKSPLAENPSEWYSIVGLMVALAVIFIGLLGTMKGTKKRNPSFQQSLLEQGVASMRFFCRQAIGEGGERFAPLVGTVFAFVLIANLMGVLPTVIVGEHGPNELQFVKDHPGVAANLRHLIPAPTANLSMTIAISLWVFFVVNWAGIKENGVGGWLKHFMGPVPFLAPLMFPLELVGALVKPVSLSIRLFGNVFGEETVIAVLVTLATTTVAGIIPFQYPMLVFGVFGGLVQAGVYTILTCAYISLSIGDHDHGHGHDHDEILDEYGADVAPSHAHAH